jgi:hypothetical protein
MAYSWPVSYYPNELCNLISIYERASLSWAQMGRARIGYLTKLNYYIMLSAITLHHACSMV